MLNYTVRPDISNMKVYKYFENRLHVSPTFKPMGLDLGLNIEPSPISKWAGLGRLWHSLAKLNLTHENLVFYRLEPFF